MINMDKLIVNRAVTDKILKDNGFKKGTFKCFIFKNIILFVVHVDIANEKWHYEVFDANTDSLYAAYYNREYGKNEIVSELDVKIEKILNEMITKNILMNGE